MKKIIAVITLLLAFTVAANAQDKKAAAAGAKKDVALLTEAVGLSATQQEDFRRLFEQKYEITLNANSGEERKKEMARIVEMKIRASISPEQQKQLDTKPGLLKKLSE